MHVAKGLMNGQKRECRVPAVNDDRKGSGVFTCLNTFLQRVLLDYFRDTQDAILPDALISRARTL